MEKLANWLWKLALRFGAGVVRVVWLTVTRLLLFATIVLSAIAGGVGSRLLAAQFPFVPDIEPDGRVTGFLRRNLFDDDRTAAARSFERYLDNVDFNGFLVAILAMIAVGFILLLLRLTWFRHRVLVGVLASLTVAGWVWVTGGLVPGGEWWPTLVAPLASIPVGIAMIEIIEWMSEGVSAALGTISAESDASPAGPDFDFSFDLSC